MSTAGDMHRDSQAPLVGGRVIQLGCICIAARMGSASNQHLSIGEQRGCLAVSGNIHVWADRPGIFYRVIKFS